MKEELLPLDDNEVQELKEKLFYIGYRVAKGGQESMDLGAIARYVLMNVYIRPAQNPKEEGIVADVINLHEGTKWYRGECCSGYPNCIHRPSNRTNEITTKTAVDGLKIMNPPEYISNILSKYDEDTIYVMGFNDALERFKPAVGSVEIKWPEYDSGQKGFLTGSHAWNSAIEACKQAYKEAIHQHLSGGK